MFCIHITKYINMITKSQTLIGQQQQKIKISIILHIKIFMKGSRIENLHKSYLILFRTTHDLGRLT